MILSADPKTLSEIFDGKKLWMVPTFQRPYSWDAEKEAIRLFQDVSLAHSRQRGDYYISPIHVIEIPKGRDGLELLQKHVDAKLNLPLDLITAENFQTVIGGTEHDFKTYLVIDGQQRLLTSYVALLMAGRLPNHHCITNGSTSIPIVVPGSPEELLELRNQIAGNANGNVISRAASKIAALFQLLRTVPAPVAGPVANYFSNRVRLLLVSLHQGSALSSFLTLNDRGRSLTTLEKFKAHALYLLDTMSAQPALTTPQTVHSAFSAVYRSLDHVGSILNDDKVVQMFGCNHIQGQPAEAAEWGAGIWYEKYVATQSEVVGSWPQALTSIAEFNDYVTGLHTAPIELSKPTFSGRTASQEIDLSFGRFVPNYRVLTILQLLWQKFCRKAGTLLWDRCGSIDIDNTGLIIEYDARLTRLKGLASNLAPASQTHFSGWLAQAASELDAIKKLECRPVSLLQLARMLNLINVKPAQYQTCIAGILGCSALTEALKSVSHYLQVNNGRNYLLGFLWPGATDRNSAAYMLALDFESTLGRHWNSTDGDQVEHIFAKEGFRSLHSPAAYGFTENEYENLVESVGNIIPIHARLNSSIGKLPVLDKANHYVTQQLIGGDFAYPVGANAQIFNPSAVAVGERLKKLGSDFQAHRLLIEMRSLELGIYALKVY